MPRLSTKGYQINIRLSKQDRESLQALVEKAQQDATTAGLPLDHINDASMIRMWIREKYAVLDRRGQIHVLHEEKGHE